MKLGQWVQGIAQKALNPPIQVAAGLGMSAAAMAQQDVVAQGLLPLVPGSWGVGSSPPNPPYQPSGNGGYIGSGGSGGGQGTIYGGNWGQQATLSGSGSIILESLPTSDPGIREALWNNGGIVSISAGNGTPLGKSVIISGGPAEPLGSPTSQPTTLERIIREISNHLWVLSDRAAEDFAQNPPLTDEEKAHILRLAWECRASLPPELAVYASLAGGLTEEPTP